MQFDIALNATSINSYRYISNLIQGPPETFKVKEPPQPQRALITTLEESTATIENARQELEKEAQYPQLGGDYVCFKACFQNFQYGLDFQ